MSENETPEAGTPSIDGAAEPTPAQASAAITDWDQLKMTPAEAAKAIAESNRWEKRAKDHLAKLKATEAPLREWEMLRDASQSDLDRVTAIAEDLTEQVGSYRARAVQAEVRAAASGFTDPTDAHAFLGDLSHYIDGAGDIDTDRITADLTDVLSRKPYLAKTAPGERRAPAPDHSQGSGANGSTTAAPRDQFGSILHQALRG